MRWTSRSNSVRSKNRFRDHGRNPLSRVAMMAFSSSGLRPFAPAKLMDVTWTSPVSRHAETAATSTIEDDGRAGVSIEITPRGALCSFLSCGLLDGLSESCLAGLETLRRRSMRSTTLPSGAARRLGSFGLLAFHPRFDHLHEVVAVLVGVLRRIPVGRQIVDQHPGHVELCLANLLARGKLELRGIDQLIRVAQHRQHERVVDHFDRGEMLSLADDDLRDADAARFLQRLAQQRIRVAAIPSPVSGSTASRNSDRRSPRLLTKSMMSIARSLLSAAALRSSFVNTRTALLVFVALDEILPGDRFTLALADTLVADRRFVSRMQHAELRSMIAHCRVKLDRNRHETKRNGAFPDGARHSASRVCKVYAGVLSEESRKSDWKVMQKGDSRKKTGYRRRAPGQEPEVRSLKPGERQMLK